MYETVFENFVFFFLYKVRHLSHKRRNYHINKVIVYRVFIVENERLNVAVANFN